MFRIYGHIIVPAPLTLKPSPPPPYLYSFFPPFLYSSPRPLPCIPQTPLAQDPFYLRLIPLYHRPPPELKPARRPLTSSLPPSIHPHEKHEGFITPRRDGVALSCPASCSFTSSFSHKFVVCFSRIFLKDSGECSIPRISMRLIDCAVVCGGCMHMRYSYHGDLE